MHELANPLSEKISESIPIELIKRWGGASSITMMDPICKHFSIPQIDGVIGYRSEFGCAIVYGDPLCHPNDWPILVQSFHEYCERRFKSIIYVTASEHFSQWAMQHICHALIEFGEEIFADTQNEIITGSRGHLLRKKMNRSQKEGVAVKEYLIPNPHLESAMEQLANDWLNGRKGPQIYLSHVFLFTERTGKRWFYAVKDDHILGVVLLIQLDACQGWALHLLMTAPNCPVGTSERLIITILDTLRKEGCRHLTFGSTPGKELGKIIGLNPLSSWVARKGFNSAKSIFRLDGRREFLKKFQTQSKPSFLLFSNPHIGIRQVLALTRAFNVSFY
jgi:lysylphosphatidylglycerol synthetase-like protein (DUF2156 family)